MRKAHAPLTSRECFVCLEGAPPLFRVCRCNALVHAHCLHELVHRVPAHEDDYCPICLDPYDLSSVVRYRLYRGALDVLLVFFLFASLTYASMNVATYLHNKPGDPFAPAIMLFFILLLFGLGRQSGVTSSTTAANSV